MTWSDFLSQQQRTFIQMRTVLKVVDNPRAKKVAIPIGKVKKGKVVSRVAVHAAIHRGRFDGIEVKFDDNAVVIIDKEGQPKGSRVFGPVPHELRKKRHDKTLALAELIA
uniref:Large subunit ribosomal protein L14 n=1 Tax=Populus alba TaxID=43335 RepID=A0A4V6A423_POPAL|nr:large subunit ribosomal protein L14 [Populus alba]